MAMGDSSSSSSSPAAPPSSAWDAGKLFVGGISWETGDAALRGHFGKYGAVAETINVTDRETGNPRGFAFVVFSDPAAAERAIADTNHVILGKEVEVRRARSRNGQQQQQHKFQPRRAATTTTTNNSNGNGNKSRTRSKKIFVGGLSSEVAEDAFRAYFEQFGTITDVVVIYDNLTRRSRGFGFIEFQSEEAVERVMRRGAHELNGKRVEVKIAVPKDRYDQRNASSNDGGGGMGYGYGYYPGGVYPAHDPRYGMIPFVAPPLYPGYAYGAPGYGGYITGAYGRVGYGAPFVSPRVTLNDQGAGVTSQNPIPYGGATLYPGYYTGGYGGYFGMASGGYYGMVPGDDKQSQGGSDAQSTSVADMLTSQVESLKLDAR